MIEHVSLASFPAIRRDRRDANHVAERGEIATLLHALRQWSKSQLFSDGSIRCGEMRLRPRVACGTGEKRAPQTLAPTLAEASLIAS
jgi:hypothetical protein